MNQHEQLLQELETQMAVLKRIMLRSREQMLGELQLTRSQIEVIMFLAHSDSSTIGDLAAELAVTHSAATQTVETLVKRQLVERLPDPVDRRIVRTRLSPPGRDLARQLHDERLARLKATFASLSDDELTVMITVLRRLGHQFDTTSSQEKRDED